MRKLLTIDDIMVAFVSALGYGYGETLSRLFGWPMPLCMLASMVAGIALERIISGIVFSEAIQRKPLRRAVIYAAFILVFLMAHAFSVSRLGVSMVKYLLNQFAYVVGFPILGFVINLFIRAWRAKRIRERYGDGSEGYVFDVTHEDIEEANRQNQPVHGEYDADCEVRTGTGVYVGERRKNTVSYLGIPYAQPPVGALRWKAPEPLPPSHAVFEAKRFGASAVQVDQSGSIVRHHRQSENCLTLNICVGAEEAEAKKPVLVLFHDGDFSWGGTVDPLLYGDNLVSRHPDIVFVSFNYRLGIFGFIDFSGIPGGAACPDALNLGLLDQVAALEWIRENIAAFGGDPERVTVIGFDAGATSICLLAATERAKGLFRRAFVFNGNPALAYGTPQASRALARDLLKQTQTATMEELLRLDTEVLKDAAQKLWRNMCAPTCDGGWLPADVLRAWRDGAASGIEFIFGIPSNERQVFRSFIGDRNYGVLLSAAIADMQGDAPGSAAGGYIQAQASSPAGLEARSRLLEQWNALGIYRAAASLAEGGNRVRLMYWDVEPLIDKLGSGTVDAAATLLGNSDAQQMYGNVMDGDLSEILQSLLAKFINGDALRLYPNEIKGVDTLDWEAFPRALVVSGDGLECGAIEDRLTDKKGPLEFMVK